MLFFPLNLTETRLEEAISFSPKGLVPRVAQLPRPRNFVSLTILTLHDFFYLCDFVQLACTLDWLVHQLCKLFSQISLYKRSTTLSYISSDHWGLHTSFNKHLPAPTQNNQIPSIP